MSILDLIRKKIETVELADDKLVTEISATEKALFTLVLKVLDLFSTRLGRFAEDESNARVLTRLSKEIFEIFETTTYIPKVRKFLLNFDKVEELNKNMHSGLSGIKIGDLGLSTSKREAINALSQNLLSKKAIQANIIVPIRQIMYRGITTSASVEDVKDELRTFIKGNSKRRGFLSRYVGQIARDSLLQYDGLINQTIASDFEFDAFQIVNSIVKSSRPTCVGMIKGTGRYADLAVRPGVYRIEDIPELININRGKPGWNDLTTTSNYLIIRNGYNCRHQFIPFRLGGDAEDVLEKLKNEG